MQPKISLLSLMQNTRPINARAMNLLSNKAISLKLFSQTKKILILDQKRALCTIIVDKTIRRSIPSNPYIEEYGWALKDGVLQPVPANGPLWPQDLSETVSCGHKKGCSRNCSCVKG